MEVPDTDDVTFWTDVGIYGWPEAANKHLITWFLMNDIRRLYPSPIIFFRDFNEILHASEKDGGAARRKGMIDAFRDAIELCDIHNLGFRGSTYAWRRGSEGSTMIRKRLDRFLASDYKSSLFPHSWVRNFPIYKSECADSAWD